MRYLAVIVWCVLFCSYSVHALESRRFPERFSFGVATASYQIEGAWNKDGKGENIWDRLTHSNQVLVKHHHNGDIACDSYHKYKDDVKLLKETGVNHYRFSISWSRILPTGYTNKINQAGVQYYRNVINELKTNNITPMVTLYHWDLPQPLQDIGGWPNPLLVDIFADYAKVVFKLFGDDVKHWMTFNEVKQICQEGYGIGTKAPAISSSGIGEYKCGHVIVKSHAKAYHLYQKMFKQKQGGRVGIVIDTDWYEPASSNKLDQDAANRSLLFRWGWYVHPLVYGDYPEVMKERIAMRSKLEGFSDSRLPEFTDEEKNTYKVTPFGIRKALKWIKDNYQDPEIIITENGYSDQDGHLDDDDRVNYLKEYLSSILGAIYDDNVNLIGYTLWSLMDNFEWYSGYTEKFGIYYVDFNHVNRTRTPKKSAIFYRKLIDTKCLVKQCD